jgi:mycothiol synthase
MDEIAGIPGTPAIPGLSFRRPQDDIDFKILAEVVQRSRDADLFELVDTPQDIADDFRHLQNCNPRKDMLFVEINGTTVGFCRCEWHTRPGGVRTYEHAAYLVPEWRTNGLRQAMLRENERRLREIASEHPKDHVKIFEARTNFAENDWKSLLEAEGYRPFRHNLIMVRPNLKEIPDLPVPDGVEIRPVRPEHHRIIFKAAAEAFRDEPNFAEESWTEDGFKYLLEWRAFKPEIWQVAWAGDEVAGAVLNFIDDEENKKFKRNWGYTMAIFVSRSYRNRGLASALIARSFDVLKREGVNEAALGVDYENPSGARRLYERMGFRLFQQYTRYQKPLD